MRFRRREDGAYVDRDDRPFCGCPKCLRRVVARFEAIQERQVRYIEHTIESVRVGRLHNDWFGDQLTEAEWVEREAWARRGDPAIEAAMRQVAEEYEARVANRVLEFGRCD